MVTDTTVNQEALAGAFAPVVRDTPETMMRKRQQMLARTIGGMPVEKDFYLAINKKELGQRWFLTTYLSQLVQGGTEEGAARTLGTAVVSFKVQNGKLFMFDVRDGTASSDTIKPELVVEAYPLVTGIKAFDDRPNASDYVLIDPSGGLNRFRMMGDGFIPIDVDVTFSQEFRRLGDGATFEQVFSGMLRAGAGDEAVPLAGTLTLGLRRYAEGEGFVPMPLPPRQHYFTSDAQIVKDEGRLTATAIKWNVAPGRAPISWAISGIAEHGAATSGAGRVRHCRRDQGGHRGLESGVRLPGAGGAPGRARRSLRSRRHQLLHLRHRSQHRRRVRQHPQQPEQR